MENTHINARTSSEISGEPRPSEDGETRTQLVLPLWPLAKSREEPCRTVQEELQFFLGTRNRNAKVKTESREQSTKTVKFQVGTETAKQQVSNREAIYVSQQT